MKNSLLFKKNELGMVMHACSPSYSGGKEAHKEFKVDLGNRDPVTKSDFQKQSNS
jgi:hypothetical protein